jgi:Protein of unknown function (DUF2934)
MELRGRLALGQGEVNMKRIELERPGRLRQTPINLQEEIRDRAYELYEQRGRLDGFDLEDWLQAEAEFRDAARTDKAA